MVSRSGKRAGELGCRWSSRLYEGPGVGRVEAHSQPEMPCAKEERVGGSAMAGEVRGAKEEGKGSFLLAENPKKQNFKVCGRGEG